MKAYYFPKSDSALSIWGQNFGTALNSLKAKYSIPDAEVTAIQNFFTLLSFILANMNTARQFIKSMTSFKKIMVRGADGAEPTEVPAFNMAPPPPNLVFDGKKKINSIVNRIKSHPAYTEADGQTLGIIGTEQGNPDDPTTWKPHIGFTKQGDFVFIQWGFEGHPAESLELQCDRGNGVWNTIAVDADPDYLDNVSVQTVPNPTNWRFRGIYRKDGAQAGQWSDAVVIPVP